MKNCIFCKIYNGEIPSTKIYENKYVYAFLDISGDYYGHTLVIPKIHCKDMISASSRIINELMKAVKLISKHYVKDCGFSGVNIINNSGASAGQSVMHLHFHIIPRVDGDYGTIYQPIEKRFFNFSEMADKLKIN